jgi:cytochrome c oxidase subunit 4
LAFGGYCLDLFVSVILFDYVIPPFRKGRERDFEGDGVKQGEEKFHPVKPKTYVLVWVVLFILTGITVSVAGMNLGHFSISVALLIAGVKSALVLNYFMHLKYEKGLLLFRWMIPGIFALLILFIGLTFFDVVFR